METTQEEEVRFSAADIVREIASEEPWIRGEDGQWECRFCSAVGKSGHDDCCLWVASKWLIDSGTPICHYCGVTVSAERKPREDRRTTCGADDCKRANARDRKRDSRRRMGSEGPTWVCVGANATEFPGDLAWTLTGPKPEPGQVPTVDMSFWWG